MVFFEPKIGMILLLKPIVFDLFKDPTKEVLHIVIDIGKSAIYVMALFMKK
jgi:hypothetical protein